jgi:hypothetical protein
MSAPQWVRAAICDQNGHRWNQAGTRCIRCRLVFTDRELLEEVCGLVEVYGSDDLIEKVRRVWPSVAA